jgi:alkyldihydroxyacetonephosphate synthase
MNAARMKHFGWGREGEGMSAEERAFVLGRYHEKFARDTFETVAVPPLDGLTLPTPGVTPPASLEAFCTTERYESPTSTTSAPYSASMIARLTSSPIRGTKRRFRP